ncbi:MAG: hypothetical protein JSV91_12745 [Phycisphaerales bacterium]|nr:MAG: hypothetical protein JSV91_12745 [Phycisphaerales bacterium]
MPTAETKRRMMNVAVFVLPLLLVEAAAVVIGTGSPRGLQAAPDGLEEPAAVEPSLQTSQWSDAQLAAADHVLQLRSKPFGPVPLLFEISDESEIPGGEGWEAGPQPPPEITLQAILSSNNSVTALIDGKTHRIGDGIRDTGWVIIDIDSDNRAVTIRDPQTERVETITADRPN